LIECIFKTYVSTLSLRRYFPNKILLEPKQAGKLCIIDYILVLCLTDKSLYKHGTYRDQLF